MSETNEIRKAIMERLGSVARPGAKAKMDRWEATQTKKHGKPIIEHTATINGVSYMIEKPYAMGTTATLYMWNDNRGMEPIATGDVAALKARAEGMRKKEARGVAAIERLANYSRPGAKAKFADDFATRLKSLITRFGFKPDEVNVSNRFGVGTISFFNQKGKATELVSKLRGAMKQMGVPEAAITAREVQYPADEDGPAEHIGIVTVDFNKMPHSRPGAKAKFAAEWMQDVSNMLRDLTKERQRVQIWVAGPTTVKVAGMWLAHNRWGTGAAIASRIAHYMTRAAGTPGNYSSEEKKDSPKKGTNTIIYTVSNVPKDAVDYLKGWGVGTSPKAFAGFAGDSAVAYSRPGAKSTHAADEAVSKKIALLMDEGYPQDQAVAIALDMKRKGKI